ncbi:transcriptional regulator BetI [Variovorax sp. PBS-H4]|uniref:TetR/AcrR family transcriptional regulator n=1 Tax=Variovorax sp. PBS-H4 TaxID=434008 RepID=UPI0013171630|nr:TetR/AcrR family transcriptional regulator [Variovorax sp. PBS-H4]VTU36040.1 transcriptional regulator BetI [Variovorax sp. PBS-H4]
MNIAAAVERDDDVEDSDRKVVLGTRRGLLKRDFLLGVVYDLIAEHGIDSLTMRQVSERSNVSTGTINYHFKNKENLIITALVEAYHLPKDWSSLKGSPLAQLRRIASFYILRGDKDRWWQFWVNCLAFSTRNEDMHDTQRQRFDRQHRFWSQLIADGIQRGELRKGLNAEEAARELLVMVHGLVSLQLIKRDAETRAFARQRISEAVDALAGT